MHRLFRSALWLCAAVFLALGFSVADAADRNITLIPGNDLPGFDYSVVKGVTIDACKQACTGDNLCRAFTYNGKAKWCFLKGNAGTPTPFAAAISGKVTNSPSVEDVAKARQAELPFPAQDLIDAAAAYTAALPKTNPPPPGTTYQALVAAGDAAEAATNPDGALLSFKQALAILPNDPAVWMKLATIALARADQANAADDNNADLDAASISAVLNGFLLMNSAADRANALGVLGHALERHQMYREAIATYRASIGLVDDAKLQARLDATVAQHGFHMVSNATDAEAATPRICVVFSSPPATGDMSSYVVVDNAPKVSIDTEDSQICITGVDYGQRYHVKLRAGLASADGETLGKDIELNAFVPDRKPFVGFANKAYVLPAGLGGGLPISSVNAKTADLTVYRIGDRSIATAVRDGIFQGTLDTSSAEAVASTSGQKLWTGQVDLTQGKPNEQTTTAIPIADVVKTI
jgi:tetratricopeptide (TPR) repeat protein